MPRYSDQFRNNIIQKMIGPERRSAPDLAKEYGISVATIYGWKSKLKDGTLSVMSRETSSNKRSPSEKLMLLLESKKIDDDKMGEWLRENGLHSQHLELWEQELKSLLNEKGSEQAKELKYARKEIHARDKEIHRKDKALAELSTLIALQKKTALLFQESEDE